MAQASLSCSFGRLVGASPASAGPLSPRPGAAGVAVTARRSDRRRTSWGTLAMAAATTLALSSAAAAPTASAFVTSPLHGAAHGRTSPPIGSNSDCGGGPVCAPQQQGCRGSSDGSGSQRVPPLVMVLTDPETLLRDADTEARMWRRSRAIKPSTSSSAKMDPVVDASYLEGLSKLRGDLEADASDFPSALAGGGLTEIKVVKTQRRSAGKAQKSESVAHEPQNIESEIEVVVQELFDEEMKLENPKMLVETKATAVNKSAAVVKPTNAGAAKAPRSLAKAAIGTKAGATVGTDDTISPAVPKATPSAATVAETAVKMAAASSAAAAKAGSASDGSAANSKANSGKPSRSSTMPGFASRKETARRRGHRDGIALVERRTGKTIRNADGVGDAKSRRNRKKASSEAMYKGSASVPDSLIAFTNEIHEECDRITPTEEIELGTLTQEAIRIQTLHDDLENALGREPTDEEWCAAAGKINAESLRLAIDEGMEAKNQLVTSNLRMVQGVVNLYIRNGLGSQYNAGDLMQEGILALIRAAEKFDPSRGFRFSTYAMYWIRAAVKRSQVLQSRIVNVPQRLHETHKRVLKVEKELRTELGRRPTKAELAAASDLSEVQLDRCLKAMDQECHSLDATIQNTLNPNKNDARRKDTMYDLVDSKQEDDGRKELLRRFSRESLVDTLRRYLSPHEVDLLLLRYGLMDERTLPHGFSGPLTIAEVSRLVGLKPDKVRRMINGCLRQLRPLIAHEWENFENELP